MLGEVSRAAAKLVFPKATLLTTRDKTCAPLLQTGFFP